MQHFLYDNVTLDNYQGTIDLLLLLVQKEEMDIYEVPLKKITGQFLSKVENLEQSEMESYAEFIASAATLIWLKSKTLLPKHEQSEFPEEQEEDPRFEIIHHLVDYCKFKQAAQELVQREQLQSSHFLRGTEAPEAKVPLGIEHLTLDDLASLFREIVAKAKSGKGRVEEEEWLVSDKIRYIRSLLNTVGKMDFTELFQSDMTRGEMIVTFLAVLELMKLGDGKVIQELDTGTIFIVAYG